MKDKHARVLAIIALIFMVLFIVALTATLIDHTLLNGSVGYIALCTGVFVFMIFIALKADGRGYSITKMKNDIEMEKIEKALEEQQRQEEQAAKEKAAQGTVDEVPAANDGKESAATENPETPESVDNDSKA